MPSATITSTFPPTMSLVLTDPAAGALFVGQVSSNMSDIVPLGPGDTLTLNIEAPTSAAITPTGETAPVSVDIEVAITAVFVFDKVGGINYAWLPNGGPFPIAWLPPESSMLPPPGPWPWPQPWPTTGGPVSMAAEGPAGAANSVTVTLSEEVANRWVGDYLVTLWGTVTVTEPQPLPTGIPAAFLWCSDPEVLCQSSLGPPGSTPPFVPSAAPSPASPPLRRGPVVRIHNFGPRRTSVAPAPPAAGAPESRP